MSDLPALVATLGSGRVTISRLADRTGVLLVAEGLRVHSLNETAMLLVDGIRAGARDERELAERLLDEYDIDQATALAEVHAFVAELNRVLASR